MYLEILGYQLITPQNLPGHCWRSYEYSNHYQSEDLYAHIGLSNYVDN